ncbi:MAG: hypothetical protein ABUT20_29750 [Bacteroidota bacterium]
MTRKIFALLLAACTILFTSCLDVEEKIAINNDYSGIYTLTMDLGRLLKMTKEMGGKSEGNKKPDKKDSTAYFKPYVDTSTILNEKEKAMLREGSLRMKMDEANSEMKIMIILPFKNLKDLPELRETYMKALDKAGIMNKMKDKKEGEDSTAQEMPSDMGSNNKTINPAQDAYTFFASPGKLSNKLTDKKIFDDKVTNDSTMQSMKGMAAMMGDMNYKTVIVLPKAVKKYKGNNSTISADKKTISFKSSLTDLLKNPQALEFDLEY